MNIARKLLCGQVLSFLLGISLGAELLDPMETLFHVSGKGQVVCISNKKVVVLSVLSPCCMCEGEARRG